MTRTLAHKTAQLGAQCGLRDYRAEPCILLMLHTYTAYGPLLDTRNSIFQKNQECKKKTLPNKFRVNKDSVTNTAPVHYSRKHYTSQNMKSNVGSENVESCLGATSWWIYSLSLHSPWAGVIHTCPWSSQSQFKPDSTTEEKRENRAREDPFLCVIEKLRQCGVEVHPLFWVLILSWINPSNGVVWSSMPQFSRSSNVLFLGRPWTWVFHPESCSTKAWVRS